MRANLYLGIMVLGGMLIGSGPAAMGAGPGLSSKTAGETDASAIERASWIWHGGPEMLGHFRKTFTLAESPRTAHIFITADNGYELFVNGSLAGAEIGPEAEIWQSIELYDVRHLLRPGLNTIGVRAVALGGAKGLLAAGRLELEDGSVEELLTDQNWRASASTDPTGFSLSEFSEGPDWEGAASLGVNGVGPWGKLTYPGPTRAGGTLGGAAGFKEPGDDFEWPSGVIFLKGRGPESSTPGAQQAIWRIGDSRAYLELDTIGPSFTGHALYSLAPARPDGRLELLLEAGAGLIGSPSVSFDGEEILFSYAPAGGKFFHIYRMPARGGAPEAVTGGPFHDFDPEPLPDGRIVFSSTRLGVREEYHGNPARSLFVMNGDGTGIHPITQHIVGDMEPKVTASGNIAFVRQDNFMERAKVETQIHMVRPDGASGQVLLGADRGAIAYDRAQGAEEDARWLRNYGFGSIAALPDGRVACISSYGLLISGNAVMPPVSLRPGVPVVDLSPTPDGRLLCTTAGMSGLGILDPATGEVTRLHVAGGERVHSPVYLGRREPPPIVQSLFDPGLEEEVEPTGFLICQNVFNTKQTEADLARIRAVRVIEGRPFTLRPAKHQYAHLGVEAVELGTVPVAADGSFHIEAPADRALALQAVDSQGRSVVNELTWIYVRPGERRTCSGCHNQRETAPVNFNLPMAVRADPARLLGQGTPHRFRGNNGANGGVLNLQFDRFREVAAINLHTEAPLPAGADETKLPPGRSSQVEAFLAGLVSPEAGERISSAQRLAVLRDRAAAPGLAAALRDESGAVRMNAALALATCGGRESVPALLEALTDAEALVAQAAHVALNALTGHEPAFNGFAPVKERREQAAAWERWFARTGWEAIERDLIERLELFLAREGEPKLEADSSPLNRPVAGLYVEDTIVALGRVGGPAAGRALRGYLEAGEGRDLRAEMAALRALGSLEEEAAVPLLARILDENIPKRAARASGSHEFGWTQRPVQLAGAAAEALGWIGTPEAEAVLLEAFPKLAEFWYYTYTNGDHDWLMGCNSSVPHFRIAEALDAMGSRATAPLAPALLRSVPIDTDRALLFENDAYETVIGRVVNRSGLARNLIEICLSILGDDPVEDAHLYHDAITASPPAVSVGPLCPESRAAQILSVICLSPEYAPQIRAAFNRYREMAPSRTRAWVSFFLARSLGKLRDANSVESLMAALDLDANEASFGRVPPPNVFLYHAMTPYYRAAAAHALGEIGDRRAGRSLFEAAANFDNAMDVRHAAALALAKVAGRGDLPRLEELAGDYPEVITRRALLAARLEIEKRDPPSGSVAQTRLK